MPHTFSLASHNSYPWCDKRQELYPKNLSTIYLVVCGSKNNKGGGGNTQISQKEKLFNPLKKLNAIWGNLTPRLE